MAKGLKTGGRQKGTKNKNLPLIQQELQNARAALLAKAPERPLMALDLLQQIYRNVTHELALRLQAAAKAIPYESPALATHKHDASESLQKVAQMMAAAAESFDEKIDALHFADASEPPESTAGDAYH